MLKICIIIFMIISTQLFTLGHKEQQKNEKVLILIKSSKNIIRFGDEFKLTFTIINNTQISYGFTKTYFAINYSIYFYDADDNELKMTSNNIIDPNIEPIKKRKFLLKPGKKKSFSILYKFDKKNSFIHTGLIERIQIPENLNEIYAKAIYYNNDAAIKLGKERLGYNMYKGKLESEKIKITILD